MKKQLFNILIVLLLFSCKHGLEGPIWDTEIIVPLVHNKMTINNESCSLYKWINWLY